MGTLKVLPAQIANMIAAGEVVGRPASVVKELMENAVDAGASKVTVVVSDAGRTLIQVTDDGCGMSPEEAVLCFERHATSKIASAEDLEAIGTFGFRGEALASIAAVAEVTLRTRREGDETAAQVEISGGAEPRCSSVAAPKGTTFAIRNLFYNTPARRKFLKSDTVEFRHVTDEFVRVAITRPEVAFSLIHNGREVIVAPKAHGVKFRILDLLGESVTGDLVDVSASTGIVEVSGFAGRPDTARKTLGNQFFFVNGRYFRSPYFHKAVMNAYAEMMPEGLTPSYFLFLKVDPHSLDVNIHPTKTEVKFEEDSAIFQVLYAAVRETLGRNSFAGSIDWDAAGAVQMPQLGDSFREFRGGAAGPSVQFDPDYNPFEPSGGRPGNVPQFAGGGVQDYSALFPAAPVQQDDGECFTVGKRYVVRRCPSGLMLVSVKRAMQRIMYERTLSALSEGGPHVTQTTLFPVQIQTGISQRLIFEEHAALLSSLGFDITPFGSDTVVVAGVPEGYDVSEEAVRRTVSDLLVILSEDGGASLPEVMRTSLAEKMSVLGASNCSFGGTPAEARQLLDSLYACDNTELTPTGRKITVLLHADDLDKYFQ